MLGQVIHPVIFFFYRILNRVWYLYWYFLVIMPYEVYARFVCRLDPKLYSEKRRILGVTEGRRSHEGKRFAIFVIYTKADIQVFTRTAIDALNARGINIVFVTNMRASGSVREDLLDNCHLLIERENLGRDFGAYKDGFSLLRQRKPVIDKLILMNDSVYYLPNGLDKIFARLDADEPFIGLTEVFEHHYHVQSFLLAFNREVIEAPAFLEYWDKYLPISTRRWSVHKGEVGLTKCVLRKVGQGPHIIVNPVEVYNILVGMDFGELKSTIDLVPFRNRNLLRKQLYKLIELRSSQAISEEALAQGQFIERFADLVNTARAKGTSLADDDDVTKALDLRYDFQSRRNLSDFKVAEFIEGYVKLMTERNQIHFGGFLYYKFLGIPILKRDLVYRGVYTFEQINKIIDDLDLPFAEDIRVDIRSKGMGRYYKGFKKVLFRYGSI